MNIISVVSMWDLKFLLQIKIFIVFLWNMALVLWQIGTSVLKEHTASLYPKYKGSKFLWNADNHIPDYVAS